MRLDWKMCRVSGWIRCKYVAEIRRCYVDLTAYTMLGIIKRNFIHIGGPNIMGICGHTAPLATAFRATGSGLWNSLPSHWKMLCCRCCFLRPSMRTDFQLSNDFSYVEHNEPSQYCPTLIVSFSINHVLNWTSLMWLVWRYGNGAELREGSQLSLRILDVTEGCWQYYFMAFHVPVC